MENTSVHPAIIAGEHLVGNLWLNLEAVPVVAAKLPVESMQQFVGGPAALAYAEMCRLLRAGGEVLSAGSLEAALSLKGFDFGWLSDLQGRINFEPVQVLERYAAEVANAAEVARIRVILAEAGQEAGALDAKATDISAGVLSKLAEGQSKVRDVEHVSTVAARLRERFTQIRAGTYEWGARSGYDGLDRIFRLVDGDLVILGARPSQGKTSLARGIARNRAKQIVDSGDNGQVLFFAADDTADKIIMAMACEEALVNSRAMRANRLSAEEWERLSAALDFIESLPIYIDDTPSPTVEHMYYKAAMQNAIKPVRLAVMDYLQLAGSSNQRLEEYGKIQNAARGMKAIGQQLGFPFLVLSQLRKEVDSRPDRWPTAADVAFAGEAEADVMVLMMRPEHYISRGETVSGIDPTDEAGICLLNIAKNKTGEVGRAKLAFRKEYSRFYDVTTRDLNDY